MPFIGLVLFQYIAVDMWILKVQKVRRSDEIPNTLPIFSYTDLLSLCFPLFNMKCLWDHTFSDCVLEVILDNHAEDIMSKKKSQWKITAVICPFNIPWGQCKTRLDVNSHWISLGISL